MAPVSLKFHGVRAFHSSPGRQNITTGGNTCSIEFSDGSQRIFVNAGFGINLAGDELFANYLKTRVPVNCTILFSDFMWDSTLGLPFFTPIHFKSTELDILTAAPESAAKQGLNDAASNLFSPFTGVDGFRASISIRELQESMSLGAWTIRALPLPHPLTPYPVSIWRLAHDSGIDVGIVTICNNDEPSMRAAAEFLRGCTTLICAATSSPNADGWDAHRTGFQDALRLAMNSGAQDLYLTQFHPDMTDVLLQKELKALHTALRTERNLGHQTLQGIHLASEIEVLQPAIRVSTKKVG